MTQWVELAVYVAVWFVCARLFYRSMEQDGPPSAEDRLAAGFLPLFWPLGLVAVTVVGIIMLPTFRWAKAQRAGAAVGWAFAHAVSVGEKGEPSDWADRR